MKWPRRVLSTRGKVLPVAVFTFGAAFLLYSATLSDTVANAESFTAPLMSAPAATFAGANVGGIPDGTSPCWSPGVGAPRNVTFNATGFGGAPTAVDISMTFGSPNHSFIGDVVAVLIAPNGASHTVFGRTLATTATAFGDASDLGGPYVFSDAAAAPPSGGWWQEATARADVPLTAGTYRTTNSGGAGAVNPQPPTSMNPSFTGVANPNGTWTLRLTDGCAADTGAITAATLTITAPPAVAADAAVDFNGDGRSDYAMVRNTGGGPSGQITWFVLPNGGGSTIGAAWGIASDQFVPEDYDGDLKDDFAVWRTGPAGVATWYVLQSNGNTMRAELFGQTGDQPDVVGDYDGDGKADLAVYRPGAAAGDPSTWFYRTTAGGPVNFVPWGQNGDFPAPGDYDGDGKGDFVVQRNNGGGQARFWMSQTTAGFTSVVFGTPTDVIVPGDYDGDGKTDLATVRGFSGNIAWFVRPSSTGVISGWPTAIFGNSATDFPSMGDYDGDGKSDFAIWRPDADPTMCNFWVLNSTGGTVSVVEWGQNGDYPVANFNTH